MHPKALKTLTEASRLVGQGLKDEALKLLQARATYIKTTPIGLTLHALLLAETGRHQEALDRIERALRLDRNYVEAYRQQTRSFGALGRISESLEAANRGLALAPGDPDLMHQRAVSLVELEDYVDAADSFAAALAARPQDPNIILDLAILLIRLGKPAEAEAAIEQALANAHRSPEFNAPPNARNRALALEALGRDREAIAVLDEAVAALPHDKFARFTRSFLLLGCGEWERGWRDYEARLEVPRREEVAALDSLRMLIRGPRLVVETHDPRKAVGAPAWTPDAPEGSSVLIHHEQGLGDAVQLARYLPLVAARARVTMVAPARLHRFLSTLGGEVEFVDRVPAGRRFDRQLMMFSLPLAFGTRPETIPGPVPYLKADPERVAHWRERIGDQGLRIAIAWQGNPKGDVDLGRSAPLAAFAPLAAIPGVRLISVQKTHGLDQLAALPAGMSVETLGEDFDSGADAFLDTAALMEAVDLVVTTDTSIVHVAGAIGRPAMLALKRRPDWHWRLADTTTPWYPTVRLYRQSASGDWDGVFTRIAAEVARQSAAAQG